MQDRVAGDLSGSPLPLYAGGEGLGVRGLSPRPGLDLPPTPPHPPPLAPEYGGEGSLRELAARGKGDGISSRGLARPGNSPEPRAGRSRGHRPDCQLAPPARCRGARVVGLPRAARRPPPEPPLPVPPQRRRVDAAPAPAGCAADLESPPQRQRTRPAAERRK